jgi:hypothetical protein
MAEQAVVATQPVETHNKREGQTTTAGFNGNCEDGVGELRLEIEVKRGPIRPASRGLTTFALVLGAQPTSHLGKLKMPELCLAAFAAAWAIDGNTRRSSAG